MLKRNHRGKGWGIYSLVVEHLVSKLQALGSLPDHKRKKQNMNIPKEDHSFILSLNRLLSSLSATHN
jgi:hypothetical protein